MFLQNETRRCPMCLKTGMLHKLQNCPHSCCKSCLRNYIKNSLIYPVPCPIGIFPFFCLIPFNDQDCLEALEKENHAEYYRRLKACRCKVKNDLYPCYDKDCPECIKKDHVIDDKSKCHRCGTISCYKCKATHLCDETCEMWTSRNKELVDSRKLKELSIKNVPLECPICLETGILYKLQNCQHSCCKSCLGNYVKNAFIYPVPCPIGMLPFNCRLSLSDHDCLEVLEKEDHAIYYRRRMSYRCMVEDDLYPCYDKDCPVSIKKDLIIDDKSKCRRCGTISCYKCKATHLDDETCEMWTSRHKGLLDSRKSRERSNEKKIKEGKGMNCPKCKLFIDVEGGCDNIVCNFCRHEICYVTKQSRWGPKGPGDFSGGCKCRIDGVTKCHKKCRNCH